MSRVLVLVATLALLVPAGSIAKNTLRFDRPAARVGQPVGVLGVGYIGGGNRGPWRLYLVRAPLLALAIFPPYGNGFRYEPPRDIPLREIGRIARLTGRHIFRVPRVAPGRYGLVAWCVGCRGDVPPAASFFQGVPDGAFVRWAGEHLVVRR